MRSLARVFATLACLFGLGLFAVAGASMLVIGAAGVLLFVGQAFIQLLMLMFIADCVEYGQWKLGRRNESVTISLQPFIYKSSNAIGSGLVGIALVWSGASDAASAADMTAGGVLAFKVVMMGIPTVLIACSWVIIRAKYRIDEERYAQIVADLDPAHTPTTTANRPMLAVILATTPMRSRSFWSRDSDGSMP